MAKTRVSELAKRYFITSSEALGKLRAIGEEARSASSSLSPRVVEKFDRIYGSELSDGRGRDLVQPSPASTSLLPQIDIDAAVLAFEQSQPDERSLVEQRQDDVRPQSGDGDRRVRLLSSLLRVTGVTDDPETVLRELDRLDPADDAAVRRWAEGDGAQWIQRPSGSAELWLDV